MNRTIAIIVAIATLLVAAPADAASATLTRAWQYKDASAAGLELDNLMGDVRVERGASAGFQVSVRAVAKAATEAEAQALVDAVEFRSRDSGATSLFQVRFPREPFARIYWPGAPHSWWSGRLHMKYLDERVRLTGDPEEGAQISVDVVVRVPEGARLTARNRLGDIMAEGVAGDVTLDGTRGRVATANGSGRLLLDTGSGRIEVASHEGELRADTGSGAIAIANCRCRINADSGSGSVRVVDSQGELVADTGSGSVTASNFSGSVRADTGSGRVRIEGLSEATELVADTGSGSVSVNGDLSRLQRLRIDTGSGSVAITASAWPAMTISVDTGSGGVSVDVPDAEVTRTENRDRIVRIGDGAARGVIDTGSGSVNLSTAAARAE